MSLLVITLNFTWVVTVLDVPLSIPVPSVKVLTEWVFVLFVPIQSSCQEPLPMPSPQGPKPHLPTPIKFNRLLYLLSGYNHSTVMFLSNRFTRGFPLHFQGIREIPQPKAFYQLYRIQPLLSQKLLKNLQLVVWLVPLFLPQYPPLLFLPSVWFPKNHLGNFGLFTICRFLWYFPWKQHCLLCYHWRRYPMHEISWMGLLLSKNGYKKCISDYRNTVRWLWPFRYALEWVF